MKKSKKCVPNSAFFHNKSKVGCVKKRCSANLPDADADADSDGDCDDEDDGGCSGCDDGGGNGGGIGGDGDIFLIQNAT